MRFEAHVCLFGFRFPLYLHSFLVFRYNLSTPDLRLDTCLPPLLVNVQVPCPPRADIGSEQVTVSRF